METRLRFRTFGHTQLVIVNIQIVYYIYQSAELAFFNPAEPFRSSEDVPLVMACFEMMIDMIQNV